VRELDCDFCGAAYEVGPAPPDRSPSDRRRLVLCEDCRGTLADAIQPLLDRLAAAEDGEGVDASDGRSGSAHPLDGGGTTAESGSTVSGATGEAGGVDEADGNDEHDDRGESDESDESAELSESTGTNESMELSETAKTSETTGTNGAASADEAANTGEPADADRSTEANGPPETEPPAEEPPQFRKVVRLLNNRSFPVERAEFVELAASAYDLEESTVAESLAYAVDRGVLAVENGQIVRG